MIGAGESGPLASNRANRRSTAERLSARLAIRDSPVFRCALDEYGFTNAVVVALGKSVRCRSWNAVSVESGRTVGLSRAGALHAAAGTAWLPTASSRDAVAWSRNRYRALAEFGAGDAEALLFAQG